MDKPKKSGPAIFMYCVIALTAAVAAGCFLLYYRDIRRTGLVLWTGITAFTIMYHLWLRLIMGNVTKLFRLNYRQWWFQERGFERGLYRRLRVKRWKDKALTYNPELYDVRNRTLEQLADAMCKSETDHWVNELISLSTLIFGLIWGQLWIFLLSALCAMAFDAQFIIIQRYNRPRVVRMMDRRAVKS